MGYVTPHNHAAAHSRRYSHHTRLPPPLPRYAALPAPAASTVSACPMRGGVAVQVERGRLATGYVGLHDHTANQMQTRRLGGDKHHTGHMTFDLLEGRVL